MSRAPGSEPPRGNPFEMLREKLRDKLKGSLPRGPGHPDAGPTKIDSAKQAAPVLERVTVRRERSGRGGKTVTLAEGPGLRGRALELLASDAACALGVGARVEQGVLVLQGDQSDRLVGWLAARGFGAVTRGN